MPLLIQWRLDSPIEDFIAEDFSSTCASSLAISSSSSLRTRSDMGYTVVKGGVKLRP
jgi:hypothetical protein